MSYNGQGEYFRCQFRRSFKTIFIVCGYLIYIFILGGYFELSFVMTDVDNLYAKLRG